MQVWLTVPTPAALALPLVALLRRSLHIISATQAWSVEPGAAQCVP